MKKIIIFGFLAFSFLLTGCTDRRTAEVVLLTNGYTEIKITGYRVSVCNDGDFTTGFKALSPEGQRVSGAVCSSVAKGARIRLD